MAFLLILSADLQLNILQTWLIDDDSYSDLQLLRLLSQLDSACCNRALRPELIQLLQQVRFEAKAVLYTAPVEWFDPPRVKDLLSCLRWLTARQVQIRTLDLHLKHDPAKYWKRAPDERGIWLPSVQVLHVRCIEDAGCCPNLLSIGTSIGSSHHCLYLGHHQRIIDMEQADMFWNAVRQGHLPELRVLFPAHCYSGHRPNHSDEELCAVLRAVGNQLEHADLLHFSFEMRPTELLHSTLSELVGLQSLEIFVNGFTDMDVERMLAACSNLTTLRLHFYQNTAVALLALLQAASQHLFVSFLPPPPSTYLVGFKEFSHLLEGLPLLESVAVDCHLYERSSQRLKLDLRIGYLDNRETLERIAGGIICKNIIKLTILATSYVQLGWHMHGLGQHLGPQLLEVTIDSAEEEVAQLVQYYPNLAKLSVNLGHCDLLKLAEYCPKLTYLYWQVASRWRTTTISEDAWETLIAGCPLLKEVHIVGIRSKPSWRMLQALITNRLCLHKLVWMRAPLNGFLESAVELVDKVVWKQHKKRFRQVCKERQLMPVPVLSVGFERSHCR